MLKSKNRLKSSSDFDKLYRKGARFRGDLGMLICSVSDKPHSPMFGFIVNKKIGNAVQRHYFQRRLRHVVHEYLKELAPNESLSGLKCSYIAYKNFDSYSELKSELYNQLDRAQKLCKEKSQ